MTQAKCNHSKLLRKIAHEYKLGGQEFTAHDYERSADIIDGLLSDMESILNIAADADDDVIADIAKAAIEKAGAHV